MKVFMSWSGARSKAAAELLHDWVKCVIQASRPWISTRGIGRGALWFNEINMELKDTSVGIICLTHENKASPWILFEAGALAKGLSTNKVCTFLVDLTTNDIQDPLAQFNHTLPSKEGVMALTATLNASLECPLDTSTLTSVFEAFWPQFQADFDELLRTHPQEAVVEKRSEKSLLEEILQLSRTLNKRVSDLEANQQHLAAMEQADRTARQGWAQINKRDPAAAEEATRVLRDALQGGMSTSEAIALVRPNIGRYKAEEIVKSLISTGEVVR